jgi:hypothetical protein
MVTMMRLFPKKILPPVINHEQMILTISLKTGLSIGKVRDVIFEHDNYLRERGLIAPIKKREV